MIYKPSRFNYFIRSQYDNALLLYNSLKGQTSLVCVQKQEIIKDIVAMLKCNEISDKSQPYFSFLRDLGFFVPNKEDELQKLRLIILREIAKPCLKLTILPTEKCNFRCKYCYETHKKGSMSQETQNAIVKFVRKNIHQYSSIQVNWFGGEPLEALDIVKFLSMKILKIADAAQRRYSSFMTTNGYDLAPDVLNDLLSYRIYTYQITIDGLKNIHDRLRPHKDGSGTYDRILENLINIKNKVSNRHFAILLRTNFSKDSIEQLDEFIAEHSKYFSGDSRFMFLPRVMGKWNELFDKNIDHQLLSQNDIEEFHKKIGNSNHSLNFAYHNYLTNDSICEASFLHSYVIGSDGKVYKCTADFDLEENNLGYINTKGELVVDEEKHAKWVCHSIEKYCENCFFLGTCQSRSCPKSRIKKQSSCSFEKNNIDDVLDAIDRNNFTVIE